MSLGSLTADSAFALGMLAVLLGALAVVLILVIPICRNARRGDSEGPEQLPKKAGATPPKEASDPPPPRAKPWEKDPEWWQKDGQ
jgi:hypothetical protein